jgi:hypothetical protein
MPSVFAQYKYVTNTFLGGLIGLHTYFFKKVWGGGTLGGSEESGVQIGMIRNTTLFLRGVQLTDVVRNRLHDVWEQERIGHLWLGPPYEPGVDGFSNIRGHLMGTDPHSDRAVPSTFNSLFAWGGQS